KKSLIAIEELAEKPVKKLTARRQSTGVQIKDTPSVSVLKKKAQAKAERSKGIDLLSEAALLKKAQLKKAIKRSKRETDIHQAGGSRFEGIKEFLRWLMGCQVSDNLCLHKWKHYVNEVQGFGRRPPAKGIGLRVADSHIGNHPKDDFMPLETIRRSYSVIRKRISFELEGETFEPERGDFDQHFLSKMFEGHRSQLA
nr:hypothetical protein [Tanacetum cinerariifolium]